MPLGIQIRYKLTNPERFSKWNAEIQDWGSLHMLILYTPRGEKYCDSWCKSLRAAKLLCARELGATGAKWEIVDDYRK